MNNLGITKAEGRAALREMGGEKIQPEVLYALRKLYEQYWVRLSMKEEKLALALVATLSGVVDAKGNPK